MVHRTLTWVFEPRYTTPPTGPVPFQASFSVREADHQEWHRALPRAADTHRWAELVTAPLPELEPLVEALHERHELYQLAPRDRVDNVLTCVQTVMAYAPDQSEIPELPEIVRCPIQSLVETVGDCEDQVILAAALLWRLGFKVALIFLRSRPGFHCFLGVTDLCDNAVGETYWHLFSERAYEYGDLTRDGLRLGDLPVEFLGRDGDIVLIHEPCPPLALDAMRLASRSS